MHSSCRHPAPRSTRPRSGSSTAKSQAKEQGRELGVYTVGVITCQPTKKEAEDYYHYSIVEHADWSAVDAILALKNITAQNTPPEKFQQMRTGYAQGMGGLPIVGDPDHIARQLIDLSKAGLTGIAVSLVNYVDELPFFCEEVLPRLERAGLREKRSTVTARVGLIIPSSNRMVEAEMVPAFRRGSRRMSRACA